MLCLRESLWCVELGLVDAEEVVGEDKTECVGQASLRLRATLVITESVVVIAHCERFSTVGSVPRGQGLLSASWVKEWSMAFARAIDSAKTILKYTVSRVG